MTGAVRVVAVAVLLASCGSDGHTPEDVRPLDDRIADAVAAQDPVVALGCREGGFVAPVWDFEGALAAATDVAAAEAILDDEVWESLELPGGEREPVFESVFRIARVLYLPVLVDGELRVLLGYDAQGPQRWSISGGLWCDATP